MKKKLDRTPRNKWELAWLKKLQKLKLNPRYEPERIAYVYAGHYTPDFLVTTKSGDIYLETKGYFRPEHKRVMVAVKRTNPKLDIRLILYSKKLKDIRWCEKHGFKYAIDEIPDEWLL